MASDVVDLRDFYRTALGQVARRVIRRAVQRVWPDLRGMRLLGLGYATPFLSALAPDTERTVGLMPASLGVLRSAAAWERIGRRWFPTFAGVVLVEATKQIYAKPNAVRVPRRRLVYAPAPHGL